MKPKIVLGTMLLTVFAFILLLTITNHASASVFTKVTVGDIVNDMGYSTAVAPNDYDADGDVDIFVSNANTIPNFLYENDGSGNFIKITAGDIVTDLHQSTDAAWGDCNGDGYDDLFVANESSLYWSNNNNLYINNGGGTFTTVTTDIAVNDGGDSQSVNWFDYDDDGDLDIFVTNRGESHFLYANDGSCNFSKVTGLNILTSTNSFNKASLADCDSDGDLEILISDRQGSNKFYINNGGGNFTQIFNPITSGGPAYWGAWGDYNNDGHVDLFQARPDDLNNRLFQNNGSCTFTEVTVGDIVNDGGFSTHASWGDYDNDGYLDLFVSNAFNSNPPPLIYQNNFLYHNNGDGTFTKITSEIVVNEATFSMQSSWLDIDGDGDLDLFVANHNNQDNFLYINNFDPCSPEGSGVVYVDAFTGSAAGPGGPSCPYATIQQGIGAAVTGGYSKVIVRGALYPEVVNIQPGIELEGELRFGWLPPIILPTSSPLSSSQQILVNGAHESSLKYFILYNGGLQLDGSNQMLVEENAIVSEEKYSKVLKLMNGASLNTFSNNLFYHKAHTYSTGVTLGSNSNLNNFFNNTFHTFQLISGNSIPQNAIGVHLANFTNGNVFRNNIMQGDAMNGSAYGFFTTGLSVSAVIEYNLLPTNNTTLSLGVGNLTSPTGFGDFVDPAPTGYDYDLNPTSVAIDVGDPALIYNDPDGTPNDIGVTGGPNSIDFQP